jgi:ligand-binding sensor protein
MRGEGGRPPGGILGIGVTTVTLTGGPLNAIVHPNPFCQCILSSASGRQACQAAWGKPADGYGGKPAFHDCHAGLTFLRCPIDLDERIVAWAISGQFQTAGPNPMKDPVAVESLAKHQKIQLRPLEEELHSVPTLSSDHQDQVGAWPPAYQRRSNPSFRNARS